MVVGIRVVSQNIQTGKIKHSNSSYFTMVAKDDNGNTVTVPRPILTTLDEVRRFYDSLQRIKAKKEHDENTNSFDHTSREALDKLSDYGVTLDLHHKT